MTLQPISFVEADARRIEKELIDRFEQTTGITLYPGDPRRLFLLQLLPVIVGLKNDINYTGNANLLPFAFGDALDGLGERIGVPRLAAQRAKVRVRFALSSIQLDPVVVPKSTRVTPDGVIYFATVEDLIVAPGATFGEVRAESSTGGARYNGFVEGQINIIVDPVPFVASAANVEASYGGADVESDDAYRERQRLAPDSFSVAGPAGAYAFFAKSADVNIADVAVTSPDAGQVNVYVLMRGGELPNPDVLAKVLQEVGAADRRPLTDYVRVFAPEEVPYDIELTYYISADRVAEVGAIRAAIESDGGAVDQYVSWQRGKIGRTLSPDMLVSRLYAAGAFRVVAASPEYAELEPHQVAKLESASIVYGGVI